MLPFMVTIANKRIDDLKPAEAALASDQLVALLWMFRPRSELVISKICYCKKVRDLGNYDALPENHAFLAGSKDRLGEFVQLYVELKNFACEPTSTGDYMTKFSCKVELLDGKGEQVWEHAYDRNLTSLVRKTRLTDFYSNFRFYAPALPPGQYQLRIEIADETNPELRRVAVKSLDFRVTPIAGQPTLR
jgi:hypothetical protein